MLRGEVSSLSRVESLGLAITCDRPYSPALYLLIPFPTMYSFSILSQGHLFSLQPVLSNKKSGFTLNVVVL